MRPTVTLFGPAPGSSAGGAVLVPRDVDPEHVGDRREDVEDRHVLRHLAARRLARELDEERREGELGEVRLGRRPAAVALAEADPVVGGDDDQGLVPEAGLLELGDQSPELQIGVTKLEQVALPGLLGEVLVPPQLAVPPGCGRARDRAPAAVREVEPRAVGEEHVDEVERRRLARLGRLDRPDEVGERVLAPDVEVLEVHLGQLGAELELVGRVAVAALVAEVAPRLVDHRQPLLERGRREQVEVDDPRVRVERREPLARVRPRLVAHRRRAEPRLRLGHVHLGTGPRAA